LCATATGSDWRTVLVGGLSGGGRGYYALDITNPTSPTLLWEFTTANSANLGYTFGTPVVTKLNDGRWVALLTSGYNNGTLDSDGTTANSPVGNGGGYLYVVDIKTGLEIKQFPTGAGSAATPSGLGQIAAYADDVLKNNLTTYAYGGDLLGNLWRFDINAANGTAPLKLATLIGPTNLAQPITTTPQLGVVNKKTVVFVGTGKYLEITDLSNTDKQSMYAITDTGTALGSPRADTVNFVQQVIDKTTRVISPATGVDFSTVLGWRTDFPDDGERVNIDSLLVNGVLLAPTIVPSSTTCSPGGYGWFNYFNYKGGAVATVTPSGIVSEKLNSPVVGYNLVYNASGKPVITVVESNDPTPHLIDKKDVASGGGSNRTTLLNKNTDNTYGKKNIWRELIR
jgi:type IV pilus assembly protein PilY1